MKKYHYVLFIGRFQPFHCAHLKMVQKALTYGEKLILLCGSSNLPRSVRNPWLTQEREMMIRASLSTEENARIIIRPIGDNPYDDVTWVTSIKQLISEVITTETKEDEKDIQIALFGHIKDSSSYYLDFFPQWDFINVNNIDGISATPLRTRYFLLDDPQNYAEPLQPEPVNAFLRQWSQTKAYQQVAAEMRYIQRYKESWKSAPYPPIFTTTDALVYCCNHILVVLRGGQPGQGLLALPGGFLNPDETLADGCLRELEEETGLKLEPKQIHTVYTIDKPDRSAIGRVITHLHVFNLDNHNLPDVHGADDAAKAFWLPINEIQAEKFHDDHYFLINKYRPQ